MSTERFTIYNRFTGAAQFSCDLETIAKEFDDKRMRRAVLVAVTSRANLSGANLSRANLSGANLYGVNLSGVNLSRANLSRANLSGVNLSGADLSRVDLSGANLSGANLSRADLSRADLSRADLSGVNLSGADLSRADLYGANLSRANLTDAKNAELAIAKTRILPDGDIIGWKKCVDGVIVKLLIPASAKRSHAFGRKCRAEYADVLEVVGAEVAVSLHDGKTEYRAGTRVTPDSFSETWKDECAPGIHFYISRIEAEHHS